MLPGEWDLNLKSTLHDVAVKMNIYKLTELLSCDHKQKESAVYQTHLKILTLTPSGSILT